MMLIRFSDKAGGAFKLGMRQGDAIHDLSTRYASVRAFLEAHPDGWDESSIKPGAFAVVSPKDVHIGPPVDDAAHVYLVGANYKKHAIEAGLDVPATPVIFMKPTTALVGPQEAIRLPAISSQMDYEGELAVVVGRTATRVSKEDAHRYVAGVTILNDLTARDLQWVMLGKNRIVDWLSSKALDKSTPVGPGLVPVKAVGDIHKLKLKTWLNDELMQDGETSMMVFSTYELIEYLSARVTLRPGDLISTGTPFGVGGFRNIFLKAGDVLKVEVEKIGRIENRVVQA
jgi:2-keto-4-pentenoate hydratase/2-oxohepta-3-ene-1,7-dioic acid hydratase in catechol pathway